MLSLHLQGIPAVGQCGHHSLADFQARHRRYTRDLVWLKTGLEQDGEVGRCLSSCKRRLTPSPGGSTGIKRAGALGHPAVLSWPAELEPVQHAVSSDPLRIQAVGQEIDGSWVAAKDVVVFGIPELIELDPVDVACDSIRQEWCLALLGFDQHDVQR